jgi:hypothetical protein
MVTGMDVRYVDGIEEGDRNQILLARATSEIDRIAGGNSGMEALGEMLDWLAHFTREHFGFQRRLLNDYSRHRDYLFDRVAVHCEFRRRLADLCIDMLRRDASVPERLSCLCRELLDDVQANDEFFSEIVRNGESDAKLRKKRRHGQLIVEPTHSVESGMPIERGEASASIGQITA